MTGGNGGIGAGVARGLLECGAAVVIAGRNVGKNKAMVTTLQTLGPPVSAVAMDVTEESQCHAGVRETVQRHGQLNILVNSAGMGNGKLPRDLTVAEWHEIMNTNLTSAFILSQAAYPEMKKAGGGKIINIGSMASYLSFGAVHRVPRQRIVMLPACQLTVAADLAIDGAQPEHVPRATRDIVKGNIAKPPVPVTHTLNGNVVAQKGVAQDDVRADFAHLDGVVDVGDD